MRITEHFTVRGHENVQGTHPTTFEFITTSDLTLRGDCIIGVLTTTAAAYLSHEFKRVASRSETTISICMEVDGIIDEAIG